MKKDSMNILKIWNEYFCLEKKFFNELYLTIISKILYFIE